MGEGVIEEPRTAEELLEELRRSPASAPEIEERCVRLCMPLARSIAVRYFGRGVAGEDLEQVAYVALVKAVRRFHPGVGADFKAYAGATIRGDIKHYFRDCGWSVRPPRGLQELQGRVWSARDDLTETMGRTPSVDELAAAVDVEPALVDEVLGLTRCFSVETLDAAHQDGQPLTPGAQVGHADPGFERVETILMLREALSSLRDRDQDIIRLRYVDGLTQREIGDRIGVTQMQVSRLLTRILRDLRVAVLGQQAA